MICQTDLATLEIVLMNTLPLYSLYSTYGSFSDIASSKAIEWSAINAGTDPEKDIINIDESKDVQD